MSGREMSPAQRGAAFHPGSHSKRAQSWALTPASRPVHILKQGLRIPQALYGGRTPAPRLTLNPADEAQYVAGKKPGPPGHGGSCLRAAQQEREPRTPGRRTKLWRCWNPAAAATPPRASAPSSRKSAWTSPGWCSRNRQLFTCPSLLLVMTPVPPAPPGRCDSEYVEKWGYGGFMQQLLLDPDPSAPSPLLCLDRS